MRLNCWTSAWQAHARATTNIATSVGEVRTKNVVTTAPSSARTATTAANRDRLNFVRVMELMLARPGVVRRGFNETYKRRRRYFLQLYAEASAANLH